MSRRGLGVNKYTGQRAAGLGYQARQEEISNKSNRSAQSSGILTLLS